MNDIKTLFQAMANEYMIDLREVELQTAERNKMCEFYGISEYEVLEVRRQGATGSEPSMYIHITNNKLALIRTFNSYDGSEVKVVFFNG